MGRVSMGDKVGGTVMARGGGGWRQPWSMAVRRERQQESRRQTLYPYNTNIVPECRRTGAKIEVVEGGEDGESETRVVSCWRTSQAFQLSHIVRRV